MLYWQTRSDLVANWLLVGVRMAKTAKNITKTVVDGLKAGETVWETKLTGFGVRCQSDAKKKVFVFKTRIGARQRWFTIGRFGSPWTVEGARDRVKVIQGDIAKDVDPAAIRDAKLRNPTLKAAAQEYLKTEVSKMRPASITLYTDFFNRLIYPALGETKVEEIKFSDVADLHFRLRETPITANRVVALLSKFFNWCELKAFRPKQSNPAKGIALNKEKSKERFLSPRELARVGVALARAERNETETPFAIAAIRLLMFTGCRRDEILNLRWDQVDFANAMMVLPETKTGSRVVYLSAPALEVLSSLPRQKKNPYVIVGQSEGKRLVNLRKVWLRICKVARLKGVRIHDLRHSFASVGAAGGVPLQMVGKLLGHAKSSTTEKYSHLAADPVKAANEVMGKQIAAMLKGDKGKLANLKMARR